MGGSGPVGIGLGLLLYGASLIALLKYAGSIHPFWKAHVEPEDKPYVYAGRAGAVGLVALFGFVFSTALANGNSSGLAAVVASGSAVLALACAYDVFLAQKAKSLSRSRAAVADGAQIVSGTQGTARFATTEEMATAGMHVPAGLFFGTAGSKPIFYDGAIHTITYGEPGSGKGTCAVVPNLMHWTGSVVVTDPKGELAAMTSEYRRAVLGHRIVYLNPWGLHGLPNTSYNPMDLLLTDVANTASSAAPHHLREREIDDARALALLILPEPGGTGGGNDPNKWIRENARRLLKTVMLYLATQEPRRCNLVELRKVLQSDDATYMSYVGDMMTSTALGGELAAEGRFIDNLFTNTREQHEYARDDAQRAVEAYDSFGKLGRSVTSSTFSMQDLLSSKTTVYVMIPKDMTASNASWLGLITMNAIEVVGRNGTKSNPTLLILDEFANLGKLGNVTKSLAEYRGNGLRAWIIVQSRRQLQHVYGDHEARALEDLCNVHQILGVPHEHAVELERRIGDKAVKVASQTTRGTFDQTYRDATTNYAEQLVPLMPAHDIVSMSGQQLLFIKGKRPMLIDKTPYWYLDPWHRHVGPNPIEGPHPLLKSTQYVRV